jgi:hypothetical protein
MSVTSYLEGLDVDPQTKLVVGVALEKARVSLGLADDFANGIIAKRMIKLRRSASGVPICYARAPSRNYAGICLETNRTIVQGPIAALAALANTLAVVRAQSR